MTPSKRLSRLRKAGTCRFEGTERQLSAITHSRCRHAMYRQQKTTHKIGDQHHPTKSSRPQQSVEGCTS
jgi:hypothetical protein